MMAMEFAGEFETHLTVQAGTAADVARLREWAAQRRLKCTHIILARGESSSQPMLTFHGRGQLSEERAAATALAESMARDGGFTVRRIKIEAAPMNEDVPASDDDGRAQPADRYFEHHVKLLLDPRTDLDAITRIAQRHAAHVSRNALRQRHDGKQERFVTQRCFQVGRATAAAALARLLDELKAAGYEMIDVEQEFVVYDSNVALDAGWIER
jgi:hypothetical protein